LDEDILFVGHSLVGGHQPQMLGDIIADAGASGSAQAQIINGAPLRFNWDNGDSAQINARTLLETGAVEALVVTEGIPLNANFRFNNTSLYASNYYNLAIENNPGTNVYLLETWHSTWSGTELAADIPFKSGGARDFIPWTERIEQDRTVWEGVLAEVNAQRPDGAPEMLLIPAGQAFRALFLKIEAGKVPGITNIAQFFSDDIHPNDIGHYFVALVEYATIYGEHPGNVPAQLQNRFGGNYDAPSEVLAEYLQDLAWQVVTTYPFSGVIESPVGTAAAEHLVGGNCDDEIYGLGGRDTLDGVGGDDALYGGTGRDLLRGGTGNDALDGGTGADTYIGGEGADRFVFGADAKDVVQDFQNGIDRLDLSEWGTQNFGELRVFIQDNGNLRIVDTISEDVAVLSNRFDEKNAPSDLDASDFVFASKGGQQITGTSGRDFLFGRSGDDVLNGGLELDTYVGGGGSDRFVIGTDRKDVVRDFQVNVDKLDLTSWGTHDFNELEIITQRNGNVRVLDLITEDRVILSNRFDVRIEPGELDAGDFIFAPKQNLYLTGGNKRDLLVGRSGDDVLDGGRGGDYYVGSGGRDQFVFGSDATDAIRDFEVGLDQIDLRAWGTQSFAELDIFKQSNGNIRIVDLSSNDEGVISNRFGTTTEVDDLGAGVFIFA
jgi:Ca2+-binding RTX toxin-like protein